MVFIHSVFALLASGAGASEIFSSISINTAVVDSITSPLVFNVPVPLALHSMTLQIQQYWQKLLLQI